MDEAGDLALPDAAQTIAGFPFDEEDDSSWASISSESSSSTSSTGSQSDTESDAEQGAEGIQEGVAGNALATSTEDEEEPITVPLQPFNHAVGGHSSIYKFTRRAVCKVGFPQIQESAHS
jgi:inositol-hexakisphosphate kinase